MKKKRILSLFLASMIAWSTLSAQAATVTYPTESGTAVESEMSAEDAGTSESETVAEYSDEEETDEGVSVCDELLESAMAVTDQEASSEESPTTDGQNKSAEENNSGRSQEGDALYDEDSSFSEEGLVCLQTEIDNLPSTGEYDYLSISEKNSVMEQVSELKTEYYEELNDEQREKVDASHLFALDLYAESYAYYQTEDEYPGQLTFEDVDTVQLEAEELMDLQQEIYELPDLAEITDVSEITMEADDTETEQGATSGDLNGVSGNDVVILEANGATENAVVTADTEDGSADVPSDDTTAGVADDASISYSDGNSDMLISSDEVDDLYEQVYDLSSVYYSLESEQAAELEETNLTDLTSFFSVGVSLYASAASNSIGEIDGFTYQRYSGSLAKSKMPFGYYHVNTEKSNGSRLAYCMDSTLYSPGGVGTSLVSETEYTSNIIKTILYYGYGGPGELVNHDLNGYCETHMAICYAEDGKAINKALGKAAYKKLYTNVSDKSVYKYVKAWKVRSATSGKQPLIYAIFSGAGSLKKVSSTNSNTVVAGAKYTVYTDSKCTQAAQTVSGASAVFTSTDSGSNSIYLEPGTYYVKETTAATGYALNTAVMKMTIKAGKDTVVSTTDVPLGRLRAAKKGAQSDECLANAVYRVYSDANCTTLARDVNGNYELTTLTASPWSNTLSYPVGTVVYVKEYTAPAGTQKDTTVYENTIEEGVVNWANGAKKTGGYFYDTEYVRARLVKRDDSTGAILSGAKYKAYTDLECTQPAMTVSGSEMSFTSTSTGSNTVNALLKQTIYLKEIEAPDGYQLSTDIYCLQMTNTQYQVIRYSSSGTVIEDLGTTDYTYEDGIRLVQITATDEKDSKNPAKLKIRKVSDNTGLTDGNSLYSLTGAEYGVYSSKADAENEANCLTTLITDEDGSTPSYTVTYPEGTLINEDWSQTFYVKELKVPAGYLWCDEIHEVTVEYGKTTTVECAEIPVAQEMKLSVYKKNSVTGELVTIDDASVNTSSGTDGTESAKAVFLMQYWDNTTGSHSGDPVKTWYFTTDEKGVLDFSKKSNLLTTYTLGTDNTADTYAGQTVTSDSLYTDVSGSIIYPIGTYWIRELAAPEGYKLEGYMTVEGDTSSSRDSLAQGITTVITIDSIVDNTVALNYKVGNVSAKAESGAVIDTYDEPIPQPGTLTLQKVSADTERTDGNDSYSLEGAVYGVYSTLDDAKAEDNEVAELTTDETEATEKLELDAIADGTTYYVKELTASRGYQRCDGSDGAEEKDAEGNGIHVITLKSGENVTVTCKETPKVASLNMKLVKKDASAMAEEMTDDEETVSFDDYESADSNDSEAIDSNASGSADADTVDVNGSDTQETNVGAGAIFALKYWKNGDGDESGDPDSVWYFRTDNSGSIDFADESYLVTEYTFNKKQSQNSEYAGKTITSDALEKDSEGKVIWSLGTYQLLEICPPTLYQLDGAMMFADDVVADAKPVTEGLQLILGTDSKTGEVTCMGNGTLLNTASITVKAFDNVHFSVLNVTKYGKDKKPLEGVTYQLVRVSDGKKYDLETTDKDGKATWEDLIPGQYVLTETATVDDYNLLAESIMIDLPCQMTEEEVKEQSADISQAYFDEVNQTYCFEKVNYQITDSVEFEVPMTGGNNWTMMIVAWIAMLLVGVGAIGMNRRKYRM